MRPAKVGCPFGVDKSFSNVGDGVEETAVVALIDALAGAPEELIDW